MTATVMPLRDPLKDNRGAIMVLGIFFACMMIGWMWMLIGLGDAVIWRDRSQEAADAISYASSAVQAKGMNLISFVNVLMLIMAAVYLLLSFVYNILDFLHIILGSNKDGKWCLPTSCSAREGEIEVISTAADVVGIPMEWANELGSEWCNAAQIVSVLHDGNTNGAPAPPSVGWMLGGFETLMVDSMPYMSKFEDIVSYATPWAGEALGTYLGTEYTDWGNERYGAALTPSLIPATTTPGQAGNLFPAIKYESCGDAACTKPLNCDSDNPGNCQQYNGGDKREGLPVEIPDKGFTALCDAASAQIMNPINAFFNTIPVVGTIVTLITNFISKQITTSFCTQKSQGLFNGLDDDAAYAIQVATVVGIDGGANNKETCPQNNWGDSGGGAGDLGCGGPGTCNHVYRIKDGGNQFWENPVYEGGPHYVVQYAYNGSDWMHVWSIVWGGNRTEQAEKKVAVAGMDSKQGSGTWTSVIPTDSDLTFSIYMAESEFYFDCADKWTASSCNGSNDASYNMNWRARLRRMHGLSFGKDLFNYIWGGSFGTTFDKKATTFIQGAMAPIFQSVAGKFATFANFAAVTGTYKALKNYAGNAIGGAINPASVIPDIIH